MTKADTWTKHYRGVDIPHYQYVVHRGMEFIMNEYVKNLNRIEFVITMACTGKCKHCSEGDHSSCTGHIDADVAANAIREVCGHYKMKSLMTESE